MHLLSWNDYLKTGVDIIDQQHRGLLDLVNETEAKLSAGDTLSSDEMRTLLGYLTDYSATHFSTEEALMALAGVDEEHVVHHRQSHVSFLQQVNAMVDELADDGTLTGYQLVEFLGHWLIYHILGEDQQLARLLHDEPAAGPLADDVSPLLTPLAQAAANRSLAKLYSFMSERTRQLQATEQVHRKHSDQMLERVAEQSAELAASEERFRTLFHNGVLPVVISRLEADLLPGLVVETNPAACALLGYEQPELLGRSLRDLVAPDEIARFPMLVSELQATGKFECEMTLVTKGGERLTTQLDMAQFNLHGEPAVMAIIQHLSMPRTAELAQLEVQRQTRRLAEIRSEFLAGTPLDSDRQRAEVAEQPADGEADPGMTPAQIAAFIADQQLFRAVTAEDQALLVQAAHSRRLQKGEILFDKGDSPVSLVIVVSGHILLAVAAPQGGKKVLGIHASGHSIGEAEVVMDSPYPYFAESADDSEVLEIDQTALLALLDKERNFARSMISCMGSRQHDLLYSVESFTLRTGAERVIGYLLQHARIHANGQLVVKLPATKQLIASLLHITPETLSRIFRDLSAAGLIHGRGSQVMIADVEQLVAYQATA